MLEKLSIRNYAIIDELELQFDPELTIITGETGAGKSILMGALSLILGERADTSVLMNRENKSVVEGFFSVGEYPKILEFLKKGDLDLEPHLVIRREISAQGKSRAFVNDTPVNLEQLRQLGSLLVDLHRQYDTLELGESGFQREVMDALANQGEGLENYLRQYRLWKEARQVFEQLSSQQLEFTKNYDYHKFLYDELEEAAFKPQELEDAARNRRAHGPRSRRAVDQMLAEVRSSGLARVAGDLMSGVNAISAPVFDHRSRVVLALTAIGDASRFDPFRNGPIARAVRETALEISARLGYRSGTRTSADT